MATEPTPIERLLGAAAAARRQGASAEELRLLDEAIRTAPGDPQALNARGMFALNSGDFAKARTLFGAAAESDPEAPPLWMNLATACRGLGDDEGERNSLQRALSIDQLNFMAHLRLAELHQRRNEGKEAALHWQGVVQMAASATDPSPPLLDALDRGRRFLASHSAEIQTRLQDTLGARIAELGPAGRRFSACLDHSLRGRRIYQNECAGVHFPFLPAEEFFERSHFPWLAALEARTDAIRAEVKGLLARGGDLRPYVRQDAGTPQNKWSPLDHSLDWSACFLWEYGVRNDAVCEMCPETAAALAAAPQTRIPGKAPTAFFSILKAGAHIPPHTGVTNTRSIVHLPLIVPPGCGFRVGGETREWREGEAFVFDDTIEHEAWNRSGEDRVVLIFDVWNPYLSDVEQTLLADFFQVADQPKDL